MADGITLNAGSGGATLCTDDTGATGHVQVVKLAVSTDGSATPIGADSTNGLDVDVTRLPSLPAGSNTIGKVQLRNPGNTADLGDATNPVRVDPTGTTTQPVSGTVTVSAISGALPAGNNNIGDVDVASLPAGSVAAATAKTADFDTGAGTDTVAMFGIALPASGGAVAGGTSANPVRVDPTGTTAQPVTDNGGSLTVDGTVAATQSGSWTVTDGGSGKTLKTASFSLTATGTVVSAVTGKRIKVYAVKLVVSAAISVNWRDGASTNLEGAQALAANGGYTESVNPPAFLFATTPGNSLDLVISGSGTAAGRVSYWDDDAS